MPASTASNAFNVNGRTYTPNHATHVVICLDGSADEYLDAAMARGKAPNLQRMSVTGGRFKARSIMPSFTNPNNTSIITGVTPAVHGIGGNFFLDRATGRETMMNSAEYLRVPTILAAARDAGRRVAVVTAKDKLRAILSKGLTIGTSAISVSSEKVHEGTVANSGLDDGLPLSGYSNKPDIYSADASVFVLALGVGLVRKERANLLYLSTTDFIQHKYAPDEPEALDFYARLDAHIGELDRLGAVLGITADHGMNAKMTPSGEPNIIYLETIVREADAGAKVVLPITDPYVVHHAALGSLAVIHVSDPAKLHAVRHRLLQTPGITEVLEHDRACRLLEMPADRTGDLVICSGRDSVLGIRPDAHDLSKLDGLLRSHGGRYEEMVPMIFNRPLNAAYRRKAQCDPRNFDIFDFTLNGTQG